MTNDLTVNQSKEAVDLSEAGLMTAAQQQTGLSDWGDDDFRAGLGVLLDSCVREADLSLVGQQHFQQECVRWLSNRLRIQATLQRHPEICAVPVRRPLFIIGLPRTGSTLLQRLLSQNKEARAPLFWEIQQPAPPPQTATRTTDPRIAQAEAQIQQLYTRLPGFSAMHLLQVSEPEECFPLFQNSFFCFTFSFFYHLPTYQAWISQADLTPAYSYYKKQLQILQWHCPGEPWILKNSDHFLGLDALLTIFPDACIVQLHRHPRQVVASLCSLLGNLQNLWRRTPLPPHRIGELGLHRWPRHLQRALAIRAAANPAQFYDLRYEDLIADPIASVRQLYAYFDYAISPDTLEQMQHWVKANPQHKHGRHQYEFETFDLDPSQIDAQFAGYIKHFKLES